MDALNGRLDEWPCHARFDATLFIKKCQSAQTIEVDRAEALHLVPISLTKFRRMIRHGRTHRQDRPLLFGKNQVEAPQA